MSEYFDKVASVASQTIAEDRRQEIIALKTLLARASEALKASLSHSTHDSDCGNKSYRAGPPCDCGLAKDAEIARAVFADIGQALAAEKTHT